MTLPIPIIPIPSDRQIMAVPIFRSSDPHFFANFAALLSIIFVMLPLSIPLSIFDALSPSIFMPAP